MTCACAPSTRLRVMCGCSMAWNANDPSMSTQLLETGGYFMSLAVVAPPLTRLVRKADGVVDDLEVLQELLGADDLEETLGIVQSTLMVPVGV